MTTVADRSAKEGGFRVIGTRPIRHDGLDKVTGRAKYGADVLMPDLLHAKVVRSPHAHARIKRIDTSRAEALPGVRAVVTSADFPIVDDKPINLGETLGNPRLLAANAMASGKVLYKGHALAAVAATSAHIAEEAVDLVEVEYEPLPAVFDVLESMRPDAPKLHDDNLKTRMIKERFGKGDDTGVVSNIGSHLQFKTGDLERGFKEADVIVEGEQTTKPVHQGYIEPQNSTAFWSADEHITVWTSTQGAFGLRGQVAAILRIPEANVKVVPMEMGGGFGGKINTYMDCVAAILSKKTGHPVKMVMNRKEVFEGTGPTSGSYMRAKIGATKDGRITAAEVYLAFEAGAFPGSPVGSGASTCLAPYVIENVLVDGYDVVVNKQKTAAYRAPGSPQAAFSVETLLDELADKLGLDPLEFRLKNAAREGDRQASGIPHAVIGCEQVEQAMLQSDHYKSKVEGPWRGRGVSMGYWGNAGMFSSATLSVNTDGSVTMVTGSVDLCGTRVALAMQAAEVLGLEAEDIIPGVGDTDSVGWTGVSGGSRTAFSTGLAVISAAEDIIGQLKDRCARLWEVKPEEVDFKDGILTNSKSPDEKFTFKQIAAQSMRTGGPVTASASSNPTKVGTAFCGNICDVEVDPETGKVTVLRFTVVEDVGQAAHPSYVEGQMQGGAVQGIGWALNEEYVFNDDGQMLNSSFLDYRMPTALDLPMIDTVLVNVPNPGHPFGLRGVGEVSIVPPMAAVANAISHAIGARMSDLPMSPAAVVEAIQSKK